MFVCNPGPNPGPYCAPAVFMRSRVPAIVCPWMRVYFKHGPSESTDRRLNHRDYPHSSGNSGHVRARHSRGGGLWSWGRRGAGMAGTESLGVPWFSHSQTEPADFSSLGEQIYYTGRGEDGRVIPRSEGMMHMNACVDCHG